MNDISLSQDELEKLGIGSLTPLEPIENHVWIVKSQYSVIGGRCFSFAQAQSLLQKAMKDYPSYNLKIVQLR